MNTVRDLLSSKKEQEVVEKKEEVVEENKVELKENFIEKKVASSRERKLHKLDQDYQDMSEADDNVGAKILIFTAPTLGTIIGIGWALFNMGVDQEVLKLVMGLLVSTLIGNIIGGIVSLKTANDTTKKVEIDMYKSMKSKHQIDTYKAEQTQKEKSELEDKYNKLSQETEQIRKENDERVFREKVEQEVKARQEAEKKRLEEEVAKQMEQQVEPVTITPLPFIKKG